MAENRPFNEVVVLPVHATGSCEELMGITDSLQEKLLVRIKTAREELSHIHAFDYGMNMKAPT